MKLEVVGNRWGSIRRLAYIALALFLDWRIIQNWTARRLAQPMGQLAAAFIALLILSALQIGFIQFLVWREMWALRAASRGDLTLAPPTETQPDPAQALQPGETLTLTRVSPSGCGALLAQTPLLFIAFAFLLSVCEVVAYGAYPDQLTWLNRYIGGSLHLRYPAPPAGASALDWIVYLAPFAASAGVFCALIWSTLVNQRQEVTANDRGITLRRPWSLRQFIRWDEMQLLLTTTDENRSVETYWVIGQSRLLTLNFAITGETPQGQTYSLPDTFSGGPEQYQADAARVLATIIARSHVSVRHWISTLWRAKPDTPNYRKLPELERIEYQPLAPSQLQPTAEEIEQARVFAEDDSITLSSRFPTQLVRRDAALGALSAVVIIAGTVTAVWLSSPPTSSAQAQSTLAELFSLPVDIFWLFVLFVSARVGIFVSKSFYYDKHPAIIATKDSIELRTSFNRLKAFPLFWEDVRAWAISVSRSEHQVERTFSLFTNTQKITWIESLNAELAGDINGDRRAAYHETARQLHALIATRTGLPLREIARS